jgi:hypothetical protein
MSKVIAALKFLGVFFAMLFLFMVLIGFISDALSVNMSTDKPLPACLEEDGSTQQECIWDDGSGLIVHNWDWGKHYATISRP